MIFLSEPAMADIEARIREAFRVTPSPVRADSFPAALSFVADVRHADDVHAVPQEARDRLDNERLRVAGAIRSALWDRGQLDLEDWNRVADLVAPRLSWIRAAAATRYGVREGGSLASMFEWDALHFVMERSVGDAAAVHVALWDHVYAVGRVPVGIEHARNARRLVVR